MTKKEQEKHVRSIQRRCRGKLAPEAESCKILLLVAEEIEAAREADSIRGRFSESCLAELAEAMALPKKQLAVIEKPDPEKIDVERVKKAVEAGLAVIRQPRFRGQQNCGADFNDVICSHPFDGETRDYECAKCGVTGRFTSPLFDEGEEAA